MLEGFTNVDLWLEVFTFSGLLALITLSLLEVVLGIDNIIFISIVASKLPLNLQARARFTGLSIALIFRVLLLSLISWIANLQQKLFSVNDFGVSGRDLILLTGGVFLIYKTVLEIGEKLKAKHNEKSLGITAITFRMALAQIVLFDLIFSLDSILTAVGLSNNIIIMVFAVVVAIIFMMLFSGWVNDFINKHPTVKMLALVFLVLIGVVLVAEGLHLHIPKAYIYSAMGFSLAVELLNMRMRSNIAKAAKQK